MSPFATSGTFMHIRFNDKTLLKELARQPNETSEELARQMGVTEKRIRKLRDKHEVPEMPSRRP